MSSNRDDSTDRQTGQLAEHLAEVTGLEAPLGPGLRAAAEELGGGRLARLFRATADRIAAGDDLAAALDASGARLPAHFRGLIEGAATTGRLAETLEHFVALEAARHEGRRRLLRMTAYPLFLLAFAGGLLLLARFFILPTFVQIYDDFQTTLPQMTRWVIDVVYSAPLILLTVFGGLIVPLLLAGFVRRPSWACRFVYAVPLLGPIIRSRRLSECSRLLGLLLELDIPLPDALAWTGRGVRGPDLAEACDAAAYRVVAGAELTEALRGEYAFPRSLQPFVEWGCQTSNYPEGLRAAAEMYEGRIAIGQGLIELLFPLFTMLMILAGVSVLILALFLPMLSIVTALT